MGDTISTITGMGTESSCTSVTELIAGLKIYYVKMNDILLPEDKIPQGSFSINGTMYSNLDQVGVFFVHKSVIDTGLYKNIYYYYLHPPDSNTVVSKRLLSGENYTFDNLKYDTSDTSPLGVTLMLPSIIHASLDVNFKDKQFVSRNIAHIMNNIHDDYLIYLPIILDNLAAYDHMQLSYTTSGLKLTLKNKISCVHSEFLKPASTETYVTFKPYETFEPVKYNLFR
ncbi:hypothetical protein [Heterosigma akashiwo virus 01]|jgi:hypothetical protein|uniref:Uncharacterized protein n=1 Tax=Heterosigma akashiwo virus 01 TaxID=97195 RepID=A0A1C9C502_HAV01|nr:hypothetical protein D1R72_gp036 [Heterosigma akashiwo virus 01]AOM63367.1 hypothetical protein [Heterosigma akashiwo virus 01]